MELSASLSHSISALPPIKLLPLALPTSFSRPLRSLPLSRSTACRLRSRVSYFKATSEENFSNGPNRYSGEVSDGVDVLEEVPAVEKNVYNEKLPVEEPKEDSVSQNESSTFEVLENLKLDSEDAYSILLYGSGAVALWLALAVVNVVDSIPLFPNLMEVVGLGYTCWFGSRYLLFKENRKELAAKIEEFRQQVLGSDD